MLTLRWILWAIRSVIRPPRSPTLHQIEHLFFLSLLIKLFFFIRHKGLHNTWKSFIGVLYRSSRTLPGIQGAIENALQKEVKQLEDKILGAGDANANVKLPIEGLSAQDILVLTKQLHDADLAVTEKQWGGIYHLLNDELDNLQKSVMSLFSSTNGLYPTVFKSCRKFEAEIIQMVLTTLQPTSQTVGLLTSGGSESILLSVLCYRELARTRGIDTPEIICSKSAHPALHKGCHYFGVNLIQLDFDHKTFEFPVSLLKQNITPNTIAVFTSAPTFSHGIIDPIEEIAQITRAHHLGLHVDLCLGSFVVPNLRRLGIIQKRFDFSVDGVTSMSADVHKHGLSPKGVSVIAFANAQLRRLTLHPVSSGVALYVTPTLQGSRGMSSIAGAWATLLYHGQNGYDQNALKIHNLKLRIEKEVSEIDGFECCVSDACILTIRSSSYSVYTLAALIEEKGWTCMSISDPPLINIFLSLQLLANLDMWLRDVRECAAKVRANPDLKVTGMAAVYGAKDMMPDEVLDEAMRAYVEVMLSVKQKN
jgi:sphinganine-1-phosphate aldolase